MPIEDARRVGKGMLAQEFETGSAGQSVVFLVFREISSVSVATAMIRALAFLSFRSSIELLDAGFRAAFPLFVVVGFRNI